MAAGLIYVGRVVAIEDAGPRVVVPQLGGNAVYGPMASGVHALQPGEYVLVSNLADRRDMHVVISRVEGKPPELIDIPGLAESLDAITEQNNEQGDRLDIIEGDAVLLVGRVAVNEGSIASQGTRLTATESKNTTQDTRLTVLEVWQGGTTAKDTEQDGRLTAAETTITTNAGRLTAVESVNTTQTSNITTNATGITGLGIRVTAVEARGKRTVCTSTTRPAGPIAGDEIFETNTGDVRIWNGAWRWIAGLPSYSISLDVGGSDQVLDSTGDGWSLIGWGIRDLGGTALSHPVGGTRTRVERPGYFRGWVSTRFSSISGNNVGVIRHYSSGGGLLGVLGDGGTAGSANANRSASGLIGANAGDYFEVWVFVSAAANTAESSLINQWRFAIELASAI